MNRTAARAPLASIVIAAAALGCASTPAASAPASGANDATEPARAVLELPGDALEVAVLGARIFGPQIEIARDGDAYRGHAYDAIVDVRWSGDALSGIVGAERTELHLEPTADDGFVLRGLYRGALGALTVDAARVSGKIGACEYSLRREADAPRTYLGTRVCASTTPVQAALRVGEGIASLDVRARAALLAVLLGR